MTDIQKYNIVSRIIEKCEHKVAVVMGVEVKLVMKQTSSKIFTLYEKVEILKSVCCHVMGVTLLEFESKERKREMVSARKFFSHIACKKWVSINKLTLKEVASFIGGRDHSTVIHQRDECEAHLKNEIEWKALHTLIIETFERQLRRLKNQTEMYRIEKNEKEIESKKKEIRDLKRYLEFSSPEGNEEYKKVERSLVEFKSDLRSLNIQRDAAYNEQEVNNQITIGHE